MRLVVIGILALALPPAAGAALAPLHASPVTELRLIHYRAHDGVVRPAWLLLPAGYHGGRIPLVISPHGRGVDENDNALLWGDLPGEGGFALIVPAGEGRGIPWYSWVAPGPMPARARL